MLDFPNEVLEMILMHVDGVDLVRNCQRVNRQYYYAIRDNTSLQLRIECALNNVVPSNSSEFTDVEVVQAIQEYHERWRTLSWTRRSPLLPDGPPRWPFKPFFDGSQFLGITPITPGLNSLTIARAPSDLRNIPSQQWDTPNGYHRPPALVMDAGQDLLIVATETMTFPSSTITLDVLSLSTGLPHPASVGQLEAPPLIDAVHRHTDNWLSVSGPHVGLIKRSIFNAGFCEIRVWDWKTGEVKLTLLPSLTSSIVLGGFTFISPDRILMPAITDVLGKCELGIFEIGSLPKEGAYDDLVRARFKFPEIQHQACFQSFEILSTPNTSCRPASDQHVPFYPCDSSRILLLLLKFMPLEENTSERVSAPYELFVRATALEDMCLSRPPKDSMHVSYPWTEWARHARLERINDHHRVRTVKRAAHSKILKIFGTHARGSTLGESYRDKDAWVVTICDFLPEIALRIDRQRSAPSNNCRYVLEPSTLEPTWVFKEQVQSYLPYREVTVDMQLPIGDGSDSIRLDFLSVRAMMNDGLVITIGGPSGPGSPQIWSI